MNELAGSSLSDIADKTAGQDTFRVFDSLVGFGKQCVANKPKNRPEMVTVYTNLQNVMSSITHSSKGAAGKYPVLLLSNLPIKCLPINYNL